MSGGVPLTGVADASAVPSCSFETIPGRYDWLELQVRVSSVTREGRVQGEVMRQAELDQYGCAIERRLQVKVKRHLPGLLAMAAPKSSKEERDG